MTELVPESSTSAPAAPPALPGLYADPNLVEFDGTYYLYPTSDGSDQWAATSFKVFSSTDLSGWVDHGEIFSLPRDTSWAKEHAWAPAVVRRGDTFFLYYSAEDNIGVAHSHSPLGPFVDLGRPLISAGMYPGRAIDPSVFVDTDNAPYLVWGNGVANIVALAPDMVSFDSDTVFSWEPPDFREAAWIHRRGNIYYLSWSENDTREVDYRIRYATAEHVFGPWTDHGVLLEKTAERGIFATGHHSILNIPDTDDWVIAYHRFAIPDGNGYRREIVIDALKYDADGLLMPVVAGSDLIRHELR
jgi:beta-xylosidase